MTVGNLLQPRIMWGMAEWRSRRIDNDGEAEVEESGREEKKGETLP